MFSCVHRKSTLIKVYNFFLLQFVNSHEQCMFDYAIDLNMKL